MIVVIIGFVSRKRNLSRFADFFRAIRINQLRKIRAIGAVFAANTVGLMFRRVVVIFLEQGLGTHSFHSTKLVTSVFSKKALPSFMRLARVLGMSLRRSDSRSWSFDGMRDSYEMRWLCRVLSVIRLGLSLACIVKLGFCAIRVCLWAFGVDINSLVLTFDTCLA